LGSGGRDRQAKVTCDGTLGYHPPLSCAKVDGVTTVEGRVPRLTDTVLLEARTDRFLIIGIDSIQMTVEVRTITNPIKVVKDVPWTAVSYLD
jgi:hypothetical protein